MAFAVSSIPSRASVPGGPPVFTDPLNITNAFHPFQPGGVKVFAGSRDGLRAVTVDSYLGETRTFAVSGRSVSCRILQEMSFEDGELVEVSRNHFAQADNGAVYCFGETVDLYRDGRVINHDGSWLVGGATRPGDPPNTTAACAPALFMPASPEVSDVFQPEDLFSRAEESTGFAGPDRIGRLLADDDTGATLPAARARSEPLRLFASTLMPLAAAAPRTGIPARAVW